MTQPTEIRFYSTRDTYGEFSNFANFPFDLDGKRWSTSEHYFQAQKFVGTEHEETVRKADSPSTAAKIGRSRLLPLRADWEEVKDDVMRAALAAKFGQHPRLRRLLLSTGEARLVEHTKNDAYWADGGDGSGRNMLGILLMELRSKLRAGEASPESREP